MNLSKGKWLIALLATLCVFFPRFVSADALDEDNPAQSIFQKQKMESSKTEQPAPPEPQKLPPSSVAKSVPQADNSPCGSIADSDKANLCRAKLKEDEGEKNRYTSKDHRSYYCSLINDRDMQNYCYAVVSHNKNMCDLVVDKNLEAECKASF